MLKQLALRSGGWQASGYLLNCGAAQPDRASFVWPIWVGENSEPHLKALITHNETNDEVKVICLPYLSQDLKSFTDLIPRMWFYNEFYTAAFEEQRLRLAMTLFTHETTGNAHYPAFFQHLCESSSLADAGSGTTTKVLSCIAWGLGNIVWLDQGAASKWYSAFRDTALRLDKSLIMPEQQVHGDLISRGPFLHGYPASSPFTDLFLASMINIPGYNGDPKRARQHKIEPRLANCERAVILWLNILQEYGIDLLDYGRQEKRRLKDQDNGWTFRLWRDLWHEDKYDINRNGRFEVRLIGFEYGRQPGDWKLWWSEPTDGLVGDFWEEMDPEPLCIPGSWDENF